MLLSALMAALNASLYAQDLHTSDPKSITVRILDGRTTHAVMPSGFQVRIDHLKAVHGDWVKANEDGSGELVVPSDTSSIALHFNYDSNMEVYVNCDTEKQKELIGELWYSVLDILSKGVVTPNDCVSPKHLAKLKMPDPKPGEIVFFVRPKNWVELGLDR